MESVFPADAVAAVQVYDKEGSVTRQVFLGGKRQAATELLGVIELLPPRYRNTSEFSGLVDLAAELADGHLAVRLRRFGGDRWMNVAILDPGKGLQMVAHPACLESGPRVVVSHGDPERTRQDAFMVDMAGREPRGRRFILE